MSVSSMAVYLKDQKLLKAGFDGTLADEYNSGDSLTTLAERYETYPAKVREQLVKMNVRIRDKNELRVAGTLPSLKATKAPIATSASIGVIGGSDVLDKLLAAGVITQADIDGHATPVATTPCKRMTKSEAALEVYDLVKRGGGNVTHRMMGEIFGYSPSWFSNVK